MLREVLELEWWDPATVLTALLTDRSTEGAAAAAEGEEEKEEGHCAAVPTTAV
jgi:hypothetical protein